MIRKGKHILVMFLILLPLLPLQIVSADVGPKPSMDFEFKQGFTGQPVTITSGTLFECDQSDCQDAKPLERLGPQGFSCETNRCSAMAYGFSTYHRLEIQFSDGITRKSNIFKTAQFQSVYEVTIQQAELLVKSKFSLNIFSSLTYILLCAGCLVGIIIIILIIVLLVRRANRKK
jgi:hypothetical protein